MKTLVTAITQHPAAKAAATTVLSEIASKGIFSLADQALDKAAERVAYHLIMQEKAEKEKGESNGV